MTWSAPAQRNRLKWVAVDFDGTIATSNWTPEEPHALPGDPIRENVEKMFVLVNRGYKIIVHTSRSWADYEIIESYLDHHLIPWNKIQCGKLLAGAYIDDRAIRATEESWLP